MSMPIPFAMDIPNIDKAAIEINGRADEHAWSQAITIEGFTTVRPEPDLPAQRATEVRIFYSDEGLYLHFKAYDQDAEDIYSGFGRRDSRKGDDYVGILLDPLATGERGALFISNPLGVQLDGTLIRGRDSDLVPWGGGWSSWDARWSSAGRRTDQGYEVEISIPWKAIRHPRTMDQIGVTLFRKVARTAELSVWPRIDPNVEGVLVQSATMSGPGEMEPNLGFIVMPELTVTRTDEGVPEDRLGYNGVAPGLTVQIAPSPALQMLGTINPDFSQVESDETKIDVNQRYSLQYQEKRPFFLEGQEWFNHPFKNIVYTRSMVTPLYGLRATSEAGRMTSAVLHVQDRTPSGSVSEGGGWSAEDIGDRSALSTIGRLRWAIGDDHMMGLIMSHRLIENSNMEHQLMGIDGRIAVTEKLSVQAAGLVSATHGREQNGAAAPAAIVRSRIRTRHIQGKLEGMYISEDFRSENGFQPISDAITVRNRTEIVTYPNWSLIPRFLISPTDGELSVRANGELREYEFRPSIGSWFSNGTYFTLMGGPGGEEYEGEWLDTNQAALMGGGSWTRWLRTRTRIKTGEAPYYDGDTPSVGFRHNASIEIGVQPIPMLVVTPILTWERFNQEGETLYEGLISRLRIELFANAHLWNRWILDQSTFTGNRSIETLFAWEHTPGRAIYLGGRHASGGLDLNDEPNPTLDPSWALFAKMGWVFER
jgi:hypothetical protein